MEADVAERVRAFYEEHPYPPPVGDLEGYRRHWDDPRRRRADHHLHWPARPFRDDPSILIAGCGTSQAAKHALRWPGARVTAVDFSAASVGATLALKRQHALDNLEVHQLPLERVGELHSTFDQIVCTGVLHHLADPGLGLRALREVLAPRGAMHLMVYAPYGRAGVYMLQELCRRAGIGPTAGEIAELAAALALLPAEHPLAALLRAAPDFRDPAALADALLHPQDRAYSVPQLYDLLEESGLTFLRWVRQAPYSVRCGILQRLPQRARLASLPAREQHAVAELYRGTMLRHSLIAGRADDPEARPLAAGEGRSDRRVPLRLPETVRIAERLPEGAAAVLINRSHTHRDLFLPIDAEEARLFAAIDGQRSVDEIVRAEGLGERARPFFERLHEHDQIVFDASAAGAAVVDRDV